MSSSSSSNKSSRPIVARNPTTGEEIKQYSHIDNNTLNENINISKKAYLINKDISIGQRIVKLEKVASLLEKDKQHYAEMITLQIGKPIKLSIAEVEKCISHVKYYAKNANQFLDAKYIQTEAYKSYYVYEPIGPIYQIIPFNYPLWLTFKSGIPNLLLGNTILHRNSESSPMCGLALEKLFHEAGYDQGEFLNVFTSRDQTESIISNKNIRGVSFTGSTKAGTHIASLAAKYCKQHVMELGGSDPFIVLSDADLETAVKLAIKSRLNNAGQVCIAGKRFIVDQNVYEAFKDKLIHHLKEYKVGDPFDKNNDMGPLARDDLLQNLEKQVEESLKQGGNLIYGGKRGEGQLAKGTFYMPTIIEVNENNILCKEETFGPVFALLKAKDENDCIRLANQTDYGLAAVIITKDLIKGEDLCSKIEAGTVFVNEIAKTDSRIPSGGTKTSGYGRDCYDFGIRELANVKTVWINS